MRKITIQDIADELGISRNTVSKAINNADGLAEATREKILQKALVASNLDSREWNLRVYLKKEGGRYAIYSTYQGEYEETRYLGAAKEESDLYIVWEHPDSGLVTMEDGEQIAYPLMQEKWTGIRIGFYTIGPSGSAKFSLFEEKELR